MGDFDFEEEFNEFLSEVVHNMDLVRQEKNISYQELSYLTGMDKSNIISIMQSHKNMTLKTLCRLCKGLDVCVFEVIPNSSDS